MIYLNKIKTIKPEKKYSYFAREEVEIFEKTTNYIGVGFFVVVNIAIITLAEMLFL